MLKLVLIFGLTKDDMEKHIIILTRGINCSVELKQITLKHCFKFDFIWKAIYFNLSWKKNMYAMQPCCRPLSFSKTHIGPTNEW